MLTSRLVEQEFVAHLFAPLSGPEAAVAGAQLRGLWAACVAELGMTQPLRGAVLGTALPAGLSALSGVNRADGLPVGQTDQARTGLGALTEGVPADLAALPLGALAGIQDSAASFRAVLRHEPGLLNLSLAMSAPRQSSRRRRGVAAGTPPGWREFSRWWGQLTAGGITALLGAATLYVAKARDATGEDVAAGLPPRDDDAAEWWAHETVAHGFPLWDVTPRGDRPDRRIVMLAAPSEDARLRGFTWGAGDAALPPMGRYLLHAASLRRLAPAQGETRELIRVREETTAEPDLLATESAAALASLHMLERDAEVARAEMARVVPALLPADAALLAVFVSPPADTASARSMPGAIPAQVSPASRSSPGSPALTDFRLTAASQNSLVLPTSPADEAQTPATSAPPRSQASLAARPTQSVLASSESVAQPGALASSESVAQPGALASSESLAQPGALRSSESVAQLGVLASRESVAQPGVLASPESVAQSSVLAFGSVAQSSALASAESVAQSSALAPLGSSGRPSSLVLPGPSAGPASVGSVGLGAEQRLGFGIDVVDYSRRSTPGQGAVQDRVAGMIARVLDGIGLALHDTDHQPAGDGMTVVLPARVPAHQVLSGLLHGWQAQVVADNAEHPDDPIRLRLAASAGPFTPAGLGFSGNTIIEIGRLLDSAVLRGAVIDNPEAELVALVSDRLHSDVVEEGYPGLEPGEFADRPVQVKGYKRKAWLWLGGAEQVREAWPVLVRRAVVVLHGGDDRLRRAVFELLRGLDLRPVDWAHLVARAGEEQPDRGRLLQQAFATHQAVIVVIKVVDGKPQDLDLLVRAGMASGRQPERTVVLEIGGTEPVSGLEAIALDGSPNAFTALAERLGAAGCELALDDPDWQDPQRFTGLIS